MEATTRVTAALQRLKAPFLELPDTRLSIADAASISGIDHQLCGIVLTALVDGRFLTRGPDGAYRRAPGVDD
jgi:hypothetical protein